MAMASQTPLTAGQIGLLFPAAYYVNLIFLGGRAWFGLFAPTTAEQMLAEKQKFDACFTAAGIGVCGGTVIGFLVVFSIGGALFQWLRKGSLAANWLNVGLAAALAIAMMRLGASSSFTVAIVAGWLLLAGVGLFDAYKTRGATGQPPPATS